MKYLIAKQSGVMLLEALIGILIFSIGILAIVGLQAASVKNQADGKYRADASYLANQIIGQMWGDRTNLATYEHNRNPVVTTAAPPSCNPISTPSGNANVTAWTNQVANTLPGGATTRQQIIVDNTNPAIPNRVTVVVCWRAPQDTSWHRHLVVTYIN